MSESESLGGNMLKRLSGVAEDLGLEALLELETLERTLKSGASKARKTFTVLGSALFGDERTARKKVHAARSRKHKS